MNSILKKISDSLKKKNWKYVFFVMLLCIPLFFINVRDYHDWGDDFAQYIHQAKNIVDGTPQASTGYIYSPHNIDLGPPAYLSGFPLMLAPVYYFFGNNIRSFLLLISFFLILTAIFTYRFYARFFSKHTAVLLVLIFVYNPWVLRFKAEIMSEIPFTMILLIIILLFIKGTYKKNYAWLFALGVLSGILISIRITGSVFIIAVFITIVKEMFFEFRSGNKRLAWKNGLHGTVIILTSLLVYVLLNRILWNIPAGAVSTYSSIFESGSLWVTLTTNLAYYFEMLKSFFETENTTWKFAFIFIQSLFLVFSVLGLIKKAFTKPSFIELLMVLYIILLLIYPAYAGLRFLFPIIPFMLYYCVLFAKDINIQIPLKRRKFFIIISGLLILSLYSFGIRNTIIHQKDKVWGPQDESAMEAFEYVRQHTPQNAIIEFEKPRALALYTGRNSVNVGNEQPEDEIQRGMDDAGVSYILYIDKTIESYQVDNLNAFLISHKELLKCIWNNERFVLYKIDFK
jgi:hypothetical protein